MLLLAVACAAPLAAQDAPADSVRRLEAAASAASSAAGLAAALAPLLDSNVTYLHPGAPIVRGAAAARRLLAAVPADLAVTWYPRDIRATSDSSLVATVGVAAAQPRQGGRARLGGYIAVWRNGPAGWRLEALAFTDLLPAVAPPPDLPPGPPRIAADAAVFAAADSAFAAVAAVDGAADAFFRYAAPDATTFAGDGRVTRGPAAIRGVLAGAMPGWVWAPVGGGASRNGELGWTVGESAVPSRGGTTGYGKYLTVWRALPEGPRFVADGGNARPTPRR